MAFKLDKSEQKRRADLIEAFNEKHLALCTAVERYNERVAALREAVEQAVTEFNEQLGEVQGFAEDIARRADEEIDDKSDKWREGERGEAAVAWKDEWEGFSLDDVEVSFPEELTIDIDAVDDFEALPEAAE